VLKLVVKFKLSNAGSCAMSLNVYESVKSTCGLIGDVKTFEKSNLLASVML
jgi:hypothetical protein